MEIWLGPVVLIYFIIIDYLLYHQVDLIFNILDSYLQVDKQQTMHACLKYASNILPNL